MGSLPENLLVSTALRQGADVVAKGEDSQKDAACAFGLDCLAAPWLDDA